MIAEISLHVTKRNCNPSKPIQGRRIPPSYHKGPAKAAIFIDGNIIHKNRL
jgi:hypothetical protein